MLRILVSVTCLFVLVAAPPTTPTDDYKPPDIPASTDERMKMAKNYFVKYGYYGVMKSDKDLNIDDASDSLMKDMIRQFQMKAGMTPSGKLDDDTMNMMVMRRCGVPDMTVNDVVRRRKRYVLFGSRWSRTTLNYRIYSFTNDLPRTDVEDTIRSAFQAWADVSPLRFERVNTQSVLEVGFVNRNHGDNDNFDGPGGTLAHAYFPANNAIAGDTHFDEDETWTVRTTRGINLYQVAVHEFGHALGLSHSDNRDAIMFAFYRGYQPNSTLHSDDIAGIRQLYGTGTVDSATTRAVTPSTTTTQRTVGVPSNNELCGSDGIDAIAATPYGLFIFKGTNFFLGTRSGTVKQNSIPFPTPIPFTSQIQNVDAVLYLSRDRFNREEFYIFKDDQCWKFNNGVLEANFPKQIAEVFPGLPTNIDAAFIWGYNSFTYFFKGNTYYKFYNNTILVRQGTLAEWGNIPSSVGAAMLYTNGRTYFFQKNSDNFYRYNDFRLRVDTGYPQSAKRQVYGCSDTVIMSSEDDDSQFDYVDSGSERCMSSSQVSLLLVCLVAFRGYRL